MSDLRTVFANFAGDLRQRGPSLEQDDGLQTAVVISLFTDRRADDTDVPPDGMRRGWWGDTFPTVPGDKIGSKLWLLAREKQLPAVVERARQYTKDALQWMVDDGIARAITVTAEIVRTGTLGLQIEIDRADKPVAKFRFDDFWRGA
ncbi:MAG: hypothetical protein JWM53_100 [bacterium]|nr:hypothetical protein [bacterium]